MSAAFGSAFIASLGIAAAAETSLRVNLITTQGVGAGIGTIRLADTKDGVRLAPLLGDLTPGAHAIAWQPTGACGPAEIGGRRIAAGAALARRDRDDETPPQILGALPPLDVGKDGVARKPMIARKVKLENLSGAALVIYRGDKPIDASAPDGAEAIVACGVVP